MPDLTKTQRQVLHILHFRDGMQPGGCWLVDAPRGRYALIVPTMMGWYEPLGMRYAGTWRALLTAELVTRGPVVALPEPVRQGARGATHGTAVALTDRGRAIRTTRRLTHA